MVERTNNNKKMQLMLLQESLWQLEDKIKMITESIADHEADLIRIKHLNNLISQRLDNLEKQDRRGGKKNE